MPVLFGTPASPDLQRIDLTPYYKTVETVPGMTYEVHLGMSEEIPADQYDDVKKKLLVDLPARIPVKVLSIEVEGSVVKFTMQGSPIAWLLLIPIIQYLFPILIGVTLLILVFKLPVEIFWLIGIAVLLIGVGAVVAAWKGVAYPYERAVMARPAK